MHTPRKKNTRSHSNEHSLIRSSSLSSFYLKARNETQQENKKYKKEPRNKAASGISIASEIPDFLTPCSWNKIEQLYSGVQSVQKGAIKYKLYHITLYLPTEPFGYNYTPVRYTGPASLLFL